MFCDNQYRSNGRLAADLKRLEKVSADYKYEFFYDKEFNEKNRTYYMKKYPGIQIVKFEDI